jgi:hypothetical protein
MPSVVIQELTAGANDIKEVRTLETLMVYYERRGKLLVPNSEDWFQAGKILYSLINGVRTKTGKVPKLSKDEKQRIVRDVLITRTAKRANCTVVTDNIKDFELIQTYCNVKLIRGKDYFS